MGDRGVRRSELPGEALSHRALAVRLTSVTDHSGTEERTVSKAQRHDCTNAINAIDAVDVVLPLAATAAGGFRDLSALVDQLLDGSLLDRRRLQELHDYLETEQLQAACDAYDTLLSLDPHLVAQVAPLALSAAREGR